MPICFAMAMKKTEQEGSRPQHEPSDAIGLTHSTLVRSVGQSPGTMSREFRAFKPLPGPPWFPWPLHSVSTLPPL